MKKIILSLFIAAILLQSCSNDDDGGVSPTAVSTPTVTDIVPVDFIRDNTAASIASYSTLFTRGGQSTVSFSGQTIRLKQAVEIGANLKDNTVSSADVQEQFEGIDGVSSGFENADLNGTTKILRAKTSSSLGLFGSNKNESGQGKINVEAIDAFIEGHDAVVAAWANTASAGNAGNVLESDGTTRRYVNEKGFELDQLFTKSLAGALAYDQAVNHYLNRLDDELDGSNSYRDANDTGTVAEGKAYTTMEHHWDESFGYIYGNIAQENLIWKYIDNVDELPKFGGVEKEIFEAYATGRLAIVEKDYAKRDEQVAILRERLSLVIAVRAVNYLVEGSNLLGSSTVEDALHDLSEGYGFVNSLRYIVKANGDRYFSELEVDTFIDILKRNNGFWDVSRADLIEMADIIAARGIGGLGSWEPSDVTSVDPF